MNEKEMEVDKIKIQEELSDLIDRYENLIFSICYRMTNDYFAAQDLTQETFLSAFEHADSFTGGDEKAWLCRIASNKAVDYLRQAARRQVPVEDVMLENEPSRHGQPEQETLDLDTAQMLQKNCKKLRPPYDEIAYLYFYEEKNAEEIAKRKNRNLKTVQTQIYRARDMLRKIYREEQEG
ncbi:MAG: RNA polymerase sigma factor [Lachnospiraceae bacterium]